MFFMFLGTFSALREGETRHKSKSPNRPASRILLIIRLLFDHHLKGSIPTTPTSSVVSDNSKDGVLGKLIENLSNPKHLYPRQNYFRKYLVALPFPSFSNKPSAKNLLSVLISESFESFRSFSSPT